MNLRDLFSIPRPVWTTKGLYECRRCKARFEEGYMRPCRAGIGTYRTINGEWYYLMVTHQCEPGREVYGVADLIGATVTTEYPETVEVPGA